MQINDNLNLPVLKEINHPTLLKIRNSPDSRGNISFMEYPFDIGFKFQRIYYLYDVPAQEIRGMHVHKTLWQCMIALNGSFDILLEGNYKNEFHLDNKNQALVIPPGYWREIYNFSEDAICLVLASEKFDKNDYIYEYSEFKSWINKKNEVEKVNFINLDRQVKQLKTEFDLAYEAVLSSGTFITGNFLNKFELEFAAYCNCKYALGVGTGLDAISLSLKAWGISKGDEVITAANGYIATALAITNVGATPVFVEPIENTYNIDPEAVKKAITPKTKVIIVTHLYGQTVNMEPFMNEISKKYNIKVFEDASQSHGAKYNDIPSGAIGHAAGFSLYPTKNLGAFGDAGIITSNDIEFINQVRMLRDYGQQVKYKNKLLGTNSRLDELQASFLLQKLKYLDSWNSRRVEIANIYLEKLKHIKEMILPYVPDFAEPVWHVFAIRVLNNKRENLMQHLEKNNIQYNIHYPIPIHLQECYKFLNSKKGSLPISERISNEILSLPIDPFHSNDEILYVINSIQNFFSK